MAAFALQWAGLLIAAAGVAVGIIASFRPRVRWFWPFGAALTCAGMAAAGTGSLMLHVWFGWFLLFLASMMLGIIAKVASTAPGVR